MSAATVPCWIYKSPVQEEMFLYLAREDGLDAVPAALLARFGQPAFVMRLDLHPGRRLAREDVVQVMANLKDRGFHLQLPPQVQARLYEGD
jgi:uncharacterized protein YcgL (UPF0745 family)